MLLLAGCCAAGLIITFVFLAITSSCAPFCTAGLSNLHSLTLVAQFITLYGGLVLIVEDYILQALQAAGEADTTSSQTFIIYWLVYICNLAVICWPIIQFLLMTRKADYRKNAKALLASAGSLFGPLLSYVIGAEQDVHEALEDTKLDKFDSRESFPQSGSLQGLHSTITDDEQEMHTKIEDIENGQNVNMTSAVTLHVTNLQ